MTSRRRFRRPLGSDRGAAAVEFAIVAVLLIVIIMGIIDFGRLLFIQQSAKAASREGARVGAVDQTATATTSIFTTTQTQSATALALGATGTSTKVTIEYYDGNTAAWVVRATDWTSAGTAASVCSAANATQVRVTAKIPYKWLTPVGTLLGIIPGGKGGTNSALSANRDVTGATTMRCE